MTMTVEVLSIFDDARNVHKQALEQLERGDIRDAAEKAWCATKRATDALIFARTGTEPQRSPDTGIGLDLLAHEDTRIKSLVGRYYSRQGSLHGGCFYLGLCGDVVTIERRIRQTEEYIYEAKELAS